MPPSPGPRPARTASRSPAPGSGEGALGSDAHPRSTRRRRSTRSQTATSSWTGRAAGRVAAQGEVRGLAGLAPALASTAMSSSWPGSGRPRELDQQRLQPDPELDAASRLRPPSRSVRARSITVSDASTSLTPAEHRSDALLRPQVVAPAPPHPAPRTSIWRATVNCPRPPGRRCRSRPARRPPARGRVRGRRAGRRRRWRGGRGSAPQPLVDQNVDGVRGPVAASEPAGGLVLPGERLEGAHGGHPGQR